MEGFRLLDLPPELVYRVLDFLDAEILTTVRRVCKVLDTITFNRFADVHFAHIYCWIFNPVAYQRLQDILQNSPRLRGRIRRLTLTDDAFEGQPLSAIHVVRNANERNNDWGNFLMRWNLHDLKDRSVGLVLLHRILLDIQDLPQDVSIAVDLSWNGGELHGNRNAYSRSYQAVFFSLAMSHTHIHSLTIDHDSLETVEDILAHGRSDFMASMSTITSFTCISEFWLSIRPPTLATLVEMLRSVKQLRHLTFDVNGALYEEEAVGRCFGLMSIPPEVLLANDLSSLESLTFIHVSFDLESETFRQVLTRCRSTLSRLTLQRVLLLSGDDGWKHLGNLLLTMPELVFVELQMLYMWNKPLEFPIDRVTTFEGGDPPGIRLEGRDNVIKGLRELAYLGPALFEQTS